MPRTHASPARAQKAYAGLLTAIDAPPLRVLNATGQTEHIQRPAARATIAGVVNE